MVDSMETQDTTTVDTVDTDEERLEREKAAEKERNARRYAVRSKIDAHLDSVRICLEGLQETSDKAEIAALAGIMRRALLAARDLVPAHQEAGGEYYEIQVNPFRRLYTR